MACPDWCDGSCAECLNLEDEMVKCPCCGNKEICEERSYYGGYICGPCKDAEDEQLDRQEAEDDVEEDAEF